MRLKFLIFVAVAMLPIMAFAQGSSLTIFSEDGDKFILYLNGSQQNVASQANLRLDGLSQPYYKARIVFDDTAKAPIEKNIQVVNPQTSAISDVVYKIKNKDGEMKLRFFSAQPIQANYVPPADVYVMQYGQPDVSTTVAETTVTTTNLSATGGVNMNMNAGGMNATMSMGDPGMNGSTITQSITTTTTRNYGQNDNGGYNNQQPAAATGCQYPMDWGSFKSAKETIARADFEDTKMSTAKSILSSNCVSTDQVVEICRLFGYEQSKLDFAKFAYSKTTDPGNYFKVGNVFAFDDSRTQLNNFTSNGGH